MPLSALDATAIEANMRALEAALANLRDRVARLAGAERDEAALELRSTEQVIEIEAAKLQAIRQNTAH